MPPTSVPVFAPTLTTTLVFPLGVTVRLYELPLPEKALAVPPVTVTSEASNPVTSSDQVNVTLRLFVELIAEGTPPITTVGAVASQVAVSLSADAGPVLPPPSVPTFAPTLTTTSVFPLGVTVRV